MPGCGTRPGRVCQHPNLRASCLRASCAAGTPGWTAWRLRRGHAGAQQLRFGGGQEDAPELLAQLQSAGLLNEVDLMEVDRIDAPDLVGVRYAPSHALDLAVVKCKGPNTSLSWHAKRAAR